MIYLTLFYEFFKTGLFAVGGGLATLPFLYEMADKYSWLTYEMLADMIAVSESTPGPVGINMATYAGYHAAGIPGSIVATLSLVLPSVIIVILIAKFLTKFDQKPLVQDAFSGLRPAVAGLIAAASWSVMEVTLFRFENYTGLASFWTVLDWKSWILFALIMVLTRLPKIKKLHPAAFIGFAAVAGIAFGM